MIKNLKFKINNLKIWRGRRRGMYLPVIMMLSTLFLAYAVMMTIFAMANVKEAVVHNKRITSMAIAEAGVNYYMWHLSHNNLDYCDGNTPCTGSDMHGPYTHQYTDASGKVLGTYDLYITPPGTSSATTVVKSIGKVNGISPRRTIIAELGMPSFTKYALMTSGSELWVGPAEKITGAVHDNGSGIYNQGIITGDASSSESVFTSNWHSSDGKSVEYAGVDGPGTFGGAKLFPITKIDMNQVAVDIINLRTIAKTDVGNAYYDTSSNRGYFVDLKASSYDLYTVKAYDSSGSTPGLDVTSKTLIGNYSYPAKGVLFFEDNVWISGTIDNQKVTIVANDPEANSNQRKKMVLQGNVKYTNYTGTDKIGLISQTDILISKNAPANMEIDAAILAPDGKATIYNYGALKDKIKIYGSTAHKAGIVWGYAGSNGVVVSGFKASEIVVDNSNILNPPPEFPKTGVYAIMSWREE